VLKHLKIFTRFVSASSQAFIASLTKSSVKQAEASSVIRGRS
jgi:hypothetical protein